MSNFTLTSEFWSKALTVEAYVAGMGKYQAEMQRRLEYVALRDDEKQALAALTNVHYVLVMTEDWCGDAVLNLPIIVQIVEGLPNSALRIVYRSEQDTLNAHYRSRGIVNIPVVTFYDDVFNELGTWVEHPQMAANLFEAWKAARPDFLAIRQAKDIGDEARAEYLKPYYAQLLADMFIWYDGELNLQSATVGEILELLEEQPQIPPQSKRLNRTNRTINP